ncbi:MAG: phosphate ABC transporter substrate-binding protein [Firmicutes bacterium]|nr:phosphate ABC transporter substrate-binding protein [Bacillota bacterium]
MKTKLTMFITVVLVATLLIGCGKDTFKPDNYISVVSREDGSGTRGAFIELFGIQAKDAQGNKVDRTTKEATIASKTDVMLTNVANDPHAIGYVSIGSLSDKVKALKIDGAAATTENVKNGSYPIARPFNIATKGEPTGVTKDFIDFIFSQQGQAIIAENYISVIDNAAPYNGTKPSGKIVIAGSSSVTPVMEKLAEAYMKINPGADIEIQLSDSTAGMNGAISGTCDIGMASRSLTENEKQQLNDLAIALDGIAVIVHINNPINILTSQQVQDIFTGQVEYWNQVL